jgi:hypothetical protein
MSALPIPARAGKPAVRASKGVSRLVHATYRRQSLRVLGSGALGKTICRYEQEEEKWEARLC